MIDSKRWWGGLAVAVVCLLGAVRMSAMVVVPAGFSEMVIDSELVVYGRVVAVRPDHASVPVGVGQVPSVEAVALLIGLAGLSIRPDDRRQAGHGNGDERKAWRREGAMSLGFHELVGLGINCPRT